MPSRTAVKRAVRDDARVRDIPVIFDSADFSAADVDEACGSGRWITS